MGLAVSVPCRGTALLLHLTCSAEGEGQGSSQVGEGGSLAGQQLLHVRLARV